MAATHELESKKKSLNEESRNPIIKNYTQIRHEILNVFVYENIQELNTIINCLKNS